MLIISIYQTRFMKLEQERRRAKGMTELIGRNGKGGGEGGEKERDVAARRCPMIQGNNLCKRNSTTRRRDKSVGRAWAVREGKSAIRVCSPPVSRGGRGGRE